MYKEVKKDTEQNFAYMQEIQKDVAEGMPISMQSLLSSFCQSPNFFFPRKLAIHHIAMCFINISSIISLPFLIFLQGFICDSILTSDMREHLLEGSGKCFLVLKRIKGFFFYYLINKTLCLHVMLETALPTVKP